MDTIDRRLDEFVKAASDGGRALKSLDLVTAFVRLALSGSFVLTASVASPFSRLRMQWSRGRKLALAIFAILVLALCGAVVWTLAILGRFTRFLAP